MSTRKQEIGIQINQLIDGLLLGLLLWLCYWLRASGFLVIDSLWDIPPFVNFYWMLAILVPFGPFLLELHGFYDHPLEKTVAKSLQQIVHAGVWLVLLFGVAAFFFRLTIPSRTVLVLFCTVAPLMLLLKDRMISAMYYQRLLRGEGGEPIIIAGELDRMQEVENAMTPAQKLELRIVRRVDLSSRPVEDLVQALHEHSVGRVILAVGRIELEKVQLAVEACEVEGVEAWLNADFIRTSVARPTYESFGRKPMLVFRATPDISWSLMLKNAMDRVGALAILILAAPIFLVVALTVRLTSKGPAIFLQQRAGLHGRPFTMLKFRTMSADAEQRKAELEVFNQMKGPVFKVDNDPRVTPIGKWLRKTSIDELPQLINVLKGEMSLVGPRPLPLYEVEKFAQASHRRRLSMKPGLTCLWQVRGRNQVVDFDEWVQMDLEYIDNWSFWLDLVILLRTIPVVLFGWGAK
jgi:exopolysaccharide biosynthesis polyprenyl glycosylphosphotransferase